MELFGNHIIALNNDPEWPPRSPDLTPCDFFLWGYIKSIVFKSPPESLVDLRWRVVATFDSLNQEMVRRAMQGMVRRVNVCINQNGGHVEGV